jgi:hypothetical protein
MSPTWKAALGVILIFILGWFGGALTTLIIEHHRMLVVIQHDPEPLAKMLERQTTRNLGLSEDQTKQLHALFVENLRERLDLQKQIQPQVKAVNGQTLQQIDALLSPDQQKRFHDNLVRFKQRFGRNPFNVGAEDKAVPGTSPQSQAPLTNAPATNAP